MENIYIIAGFLLFLLIYKLVTFLFFLRLKAKLKNGNITSFTKVLGEKYQRRITLIGLERYKWSKWWVTIKANFDEKGNLNCQRIKPLLISRLKTEVLFTS